MIDYDLARKVRELETRLRDLELVETGSWRMLSTPLTSGSWSGGATFSTTAKTLIDLHSVFGTPVGIRAVMVYVSLRDTSSASGDYYLVLSPNDVANSGNIITADRSGNNYNTRRFDIVSCNANGNIYYQVKASGANTMTIIIQVWGYLL